jgi:hypothetical protein
MPACPESPSPGPALHLAAADGAAVPSLRADPGQPRGYIPTPVTVLDQQSFNPNVPNVARVYDVLLGRCFH